MICRNAASRLARVMLAAFFFVPYGLWCVNLEAVAFVPYGLVLSCLRLLCYLIMEYGLKLTDKRV